MGSSRHDESQESTAHPLPEGKQPYPTRPGQAPFKDLEQLLDVDTLSDTREAVRAVKSQAARKLEMLEDMHRDLLRRAREIVDKAREDLRLHNIRMYAGKIRNKIYYLYASGKTSDDLFFSILSPDEYLKADPDARYCGAYQLNSDSTWTRLDPS
ncbi:MAG TPA: DUF2452 domain-containing protein [bacterium]|nr:DUF2452 domain-containing protein [bacterium]